MSESFAIDSVDATRRGAMKVENVREFLITMEEQMLTTRFRLSMDCALNFCRCTMEFHY
jgi:hypothetical protein